MGMQAGERKSKAKYLELDTKGGQCSRSPSRKMGQAVQERAEKSKKAHGCDLQTSGFAQQQLLDEFIPTLSEYELERLQRIRENEAAIARLGISGTSSLSL